MVSSFAREELAVCHESRNHAPRPAIRDFLQPKRKRNAELSQTDLGYLQRCPPKDVLIITVMKQNNLQMMKHNRRTIVDFQGYEHQLCVVHEKTPVLAQKAYLGGDKSM